MNIALFDDQRRWCRKTADAFEKGVEDLRPTRILSTAATGAGKTVMSSAMGYWAIRKHGGRFLFLADTDELVDQAAKKFYDCTGLIPSIEKAHQVGSKKAFPIVGSIQTISQPKRLATWPADHFRLVVADEAHLSMADSWQRVLRRFNDGGAWILGITATPERGDGKDLWSFYEHHGDDIPLFDLIEAGRLAPITVEQVPLEIRAAKPADTYSDDGNAMEESIEPYWQAIIEEWKTRASGRPTLVFHPGIRASKRFTELLQKTGITARHVDGQTANRREILDDFEAGRFQVLNNAQLLTKGYDCPPISCVMILRPTRSRVAYQQMVGRGTRISPATGKTDMLLLDFLWEFEENMRACGPEDIVTADPETADRIRERRRANPDATLDLVGMAHDAQREVEKGIIDRLKDLAQKRRALRFDARDLSALLHQPKLLDYRPRAEWERQPPSPRQKQILQQFGVKVAGIRTRGEASALLTAILERKDQGLASPKQVAACAAGDVPKAHQLTFEQASEHLDRLIGTRNRWPA